MELSQILIIIAFDAGAFIFGLLTGITYRAVKRKATKLKRPSVIKNADWLTLISYYPSEPTDFLSSHKKQKGEKLWKK
ncbi:MAG: hypothetical protein U0M42_09340 [Acutalibacteraceae bacterium]|nr:hypothetical protein [Acutalibacteraceae bacterium]